MSFTLTVKRSSLSFTATYREGILTGDAYLVARLLTEIKLRQAEKRNLGAINYTPTGKYLADPVAVKLIAESIFPGVTFQGDVPEPEELPDGAV